MGAARRVGAVARKVAQTLRHDPRSVAPMLLGPIVMMAVFGFAFGSEVRDVPVVVVNEDEGDLAGRIVRHLDPETLDVRFQPSLAAARAAVERGEARAALRFPPGFTEDASPGEGTPPQCTGVPPVQSCVPGEPPRPPRGTNVTVVLDGSNSQVAAAVLSALGDAMRAAAEEQGQRAPVGVAAEYAYAEGATFLDFFVPGILVFAALVFTTMLTLLAFVGERTSGTLARLLASPIRAWELVAGYALGFGALAAAQGAILFAVAIWLFDALVVGDLALAFAVVLLMAVDAMSLGILLSAAARREAQAVQLVPLVIFPTFLLSGIFVPVESLPAVLRPLAYAIPPTYAVDALRDVMLRGRGLDAILPELAVLAGFAAVFLALAVVGVRRARA